MLLSKPDTISHFAVDTAVEYETAKLIQAPDRVSSSMLESFRRTKIIGRITTTLRFNALLTISRCGVPLNLDLA